MTATNLLGRLCACCCLLAAAACLGSASPGLPPVRWFDPLPEPPPADRAGPGDAFGVRVIAPPHLGRELVVRIGARELAFDAENQWLIEPAQAVAVIAGRAFAGVGNVDELELRIDAYELDVTAAPRAHVRIAVAGRGGTGARVVEAWADSRDRTAPSFAAAMATALADVQQQLRPH